MKDDPFPDDKRFKKAKMGPRPFFGEFRTHPITTGSWRHGAGNSRYDMGEWQERNVIGRDSVLMKYAKSSNQPFPSPLPRTYIYRNLECSLDFSQRRNEDTFGQ